MNGCHLLLSNTDKLAGCLSGTWYQMVSSSPSRSGLWLSSLVLWQVFINFSCHLATSGKGSRSQNKNIRWQTPRGGMWGADAVTGGELAPCQPHTYLSCLKRQTIQGLLAGDSHSVTSLSTLHPLWFVYNNLAQWFYVVWRAQDGGSHVWHVGQRTSSLCSVSAQVFGAAGSPL